MRLLFFLCFSLLTLGCAAQEDTFTEEALSDVFVAEDDTQQSFGSILEKFKGKTILIDVWATWCRDCIVGMPELKQLQQQHPDVIFLFLSLDKSLERWKWGIDHYELEGAHYFIASGWNGPFGSGIRLDWVPRYMVVGPTGEIKLYKAIKARDINLKRALQ